MALHSRPRPTRAQGQLLINAVTGQVPTAISLIRKRRLYVHWAQSHCCGWHESIAGLIFCDPWTDVVHLLCFFGFLSRGLALRRSVLSFRSFSKARWRRVVDNERCWFAFTPIAAKR